MRLNVAILRTPSNGVDYLHYTVLTYNLSFFLAKLISFETYKYVFLNTH